MVETEYFRPDWHSPPGDTILAILAQQNLSIPEFADEISLSTDQAWNLTRGLISINQDLAKHLERVLGPSKAFWLNRERQYREDAARNLASIPAEDDREWLKCFPVRDMMKYGWIKRSTAFSDKLDACLRFFDVPNVPSWHTRYRSQLALAAFRTSPTLPANPAAVLTWLRWGEIQSEQIDCKPWNAQKFLDYMQEIRALTRRREPQLFLDELRKICALCGVAFVLARAPTGCRASGATRFLTPEKAIIMLSLRYRSDDHFWFSFFHEAGHLVIHAKNAMFLEDDSEVTSSEECQANDFARRVLFPDATFDHLLTMQITVRNVVRFARKIGVSPGIVVGQLQHLGRLKYSRYNGLKRRYHWQSVPQNMLSL